MTNGSIVGAIQVTGDQVELVKAAHIDMPAPGEPELTERPEHGMYVELRGRRVAASSLAVRSGGVGASLGLGMFD